MFQRGESCHAVARLEVDKKKADVEGVRRRPVGLVAFYPASIGSPDRPTPSGTLKVTSDQRQADLPLQSATTSSSSVKSREPFDVKPGPNNPVGAYWIRPVRAGLRHPRDGGARQGQQVRVPRLRQAHQLGRAHARRQSSSAARPSSSSMRRRSPRRSGGGNLPQSAPRTSPSESPCASRSRRRRRATTRSGRTPAAASS